MGYIRMKVITYDDLLEFSDELQLEVKEYLDRQIKKKHAEAIDLAQYIEINRIIDH